MDELLHKPESTTSPLVLWRPHPPALSPSFTWDWDFPATSPLLYNFFRWISWFGGEQVLAASQQRVQKKEISDFAHVKVLSFHPHSSLVVWPETSMLEVTFHQCFGVSAPLVTRGQVWSSSDFWPFQGWVSSPWKLSASLNPFQFRCLVAMCLCSCSSVVLGLWSANSLNLESHIH